MSYIGSQLSLLRFSSIISLSTLTTVAESKTRKIQPDKKEEYNFIIEILHDAGK